MTTHQSIAPALVPGFSLTPMVTTLAGLSDSALLSQLFDLVKQDRELTVALLLHLGEVEARGLHCAKGCSSLFAYCVQRLGCSEDVAYKRVGAARLGRRFPFAFELVARGELHLTAIMLLRPHLTEANHREWLLAACKKTKREVEQLVAARCPKPDVASSVRKLPERPSLLGDGALSRGTKGEPAEPTPTRVAEPGVVAEQGVVAEKSEVTGGPLSVMDHPVHEAESLPSRALAITSSTLGIAARITQGEPARVQPLSGSSYRVVFTAGAALKQKLDRARELVSHSVAPGDLSALVERAIDLLILSEEKRRFAVRVPRENSTKGKQAALPSVSTERDSELIAASASTHPSVSTQRDPDLDASSLQPNCHASGAPDVAGAASDSGHRARQPRSQSSRKPDRAGSLAPEFSRYVPASVRRALWERDAGQCTFVDDEGNRCIERCFLQIDHDMPHARGGTSTLGNCSLKCAAHNAHAAKLAFGKDFMERAMLRARAK